jgi:DNA-binding NarL/FixJ family response regulator
VDTRIGVFVLSNNRLLRESIESMVRKKPDLDLQGAGSICADSKNEVIKSGAEVLVVDSLQFVLERDGSWGTPWNENRRINVVLVAMDDDKKHFLSAVRKGAVGYVLQDAPAIEVVSAIRAVTRGEAMCPPPFTRLLFDYVVSLSADLPNARARQQWGLTRREQQLIPLIGRGMTNKEIAMQLSLSQETVKNHVQGFCARWVRRIGLRYSRRAKQKQQCTRFRRTDAHANLLA